MNTAVTGRIEEKLTQLYRSFGYGRFSVRHFEPYDLYVRYKNFLTFKQVLTFTDTDGSLLALKPDITLSVARSVPGGKVLSKVFYTENVYRVPEHENRFRELRQSGLECIGPVGPYEEAETLLLACRSLESISRRSLLDVSHMGILSGILAGCGADDDLKKAVLRASSGKNLPALQQLVRSGELAEQTYTLLRGLLTCYGPAEAVLEQAGTLPLPPESRVSLDQLRSLLASLQQAGCGNIRVDFSLWEDPDYYHGLVFRGYVDGVPAAVLSGGRYDPLLQSLGKSGGAIGFAVYLSTLEAYGEQENEPELDVLLLCEEASQIPETLRTAEKLAREGRTVRVQQSVPEGVRARQILRPGEVSP